MSKATNWIINDAYFSKSTEIVNPIPGKQLALHELYANSIANIPETTMDNIVLNPKYLYILLFAKSSEYYLKSSELSYRDILDDDQFVLLNKYEFYVAGYVIVNKLTKHKCEIEYIESRIKSDKLQPFEIENHMLYKLVEDKPALPLPVCIHNREFWKYYFDNCCDDLSVNGVDELVELFDKNKIHQLTSEELKMFI